MTLAPDRSGVPTQARLAMADVLQGTGAVPRVGGGCAAADRSSTMARFRPDPRSEAYDGPLGSATGRVRRMERGKLALRGTLETFPLADVLRLWTITNQSGRLKLQAPAGTGSVWKGEGSIVAASSSRVGDVPANEALADLLRWTPARSLSPPRSPSAGALACTIPSSCSAMPSSWSTSGTTCRPCAVAQAPRRARLGPSEPCGQRSMPPDGAGSLPLAAAALCGSWPPRST